MQFIKKKVGAVCGQAILVKLWSECEDEFNLGMLEDLSESLGIEVNTSNVIMERYYVVVDGILEKMMGDGSGYRWMEFVWQRF